MGRSVRRTESNFYGDMPERWKRGTASATSWSTRQQIRRRYGRRITDQSIRPPEGMPPDTDDRCDGGMDFVAQTPKRKANKQPRRFGEYSQESLFSISVKSLFTFPST